MTGQSAAAKNVKGQIRESSRLLLPWHSSQASWHCSPGAITSSPPTTVHSTTLSLRPLVASRSHPSLPPAPCAWSLRSACLPLLPLFILARPGYALSWHLQAILHSLRTLGWALCACACSSLAEELGKGAHGKVYKGLDQDTGMFVAVKEISLEKIAQGDLASITVSRCSCHCAA